MATIRAVLLDVGGTLWPDAFTQNVDDHICTQLAALLPDHDPHDVLRQLRQALQADTDPLVQTTYACLEATPFGADPVALCRALCVSASCGISFFPGATDLLATCSALQLQTVVVSNVQVRAAAEYWRDFQELQVARYIDAVVTSLDVGFRKPHPAMFEAALHAAGCKADEAVMIGDSEIKDIQPALRLGMHTIRVAIETPMPDTSAADAIATSLGEVAELVRRWAAPQQVPNA